MASILTLVLIASTLRHTALVSANANLAHVDRSRRPQPISQAHQIVKGRPSRSCPPVDKEGYRLDLHSEDTKSIRCVYKSPVDDEKEAYCLYDKVGYLQDTRSTITYLPFLNAGFACPDARPPQ